MTDSAELDEARRRFMEARDLILDKRYPGGPLAGMTHAVLAAYTFFQSAFGRESPDAIFPLQELLIRLTDISSGVPVNEFKIDTSNRPPDGVRLATFKRNCAQALSLYQRNGMGIGAAAEKLARLLRPHVGEIKPRTIQDWRRALEGASRNDEAAQRYREELAASGPLSNDQIDRQVTALGEAYTGLNVRAHGNRVQHRRLKRTKAD